MVIVQWVSDTVGVAAHSSKLIRPHVKDPLVPFSPACDPSTLNTVEILLEPVNTCI